MSLISVLAVTVGVAVLITVLSVMSGFGYELQKRIVGSHPHIIIEKEGGIDNHGQVSDRISRIEHVRGFYPYIWGQGVLRYRSRARGVVIRSVDVGNTTDISKLAAHMQLGDIRLGKDRIILGSELSAALGAFVGDELGVITPSSKKIGKLEVAGIFSSGYYEYDLNLAYVSLDSASRLFGMEGLVGGIGVDIDDIKNAASVKHALEEILPGYYIRTWMDMNRNLFSALKLEKFAMFVILTLIVIVAAFNIVSTLTVMVTEKAKDIGILKAIGATKAVIMTIFSLQGFIIGLIGVILGAGGGIGLTLVLKKYRFAILPGDIYYGINYLPVKINAVDYLVIIAAALLISLIASIYPAYQASRVHPAEALRYE